MAEDLRPVSRRSRPNEFGKGGQDRVAVYQGEKPIDVIEMTSENRQNDALKKASKTHQVMKKWGLSRREAAYLLALVGSSTAIEAWRKAFPKDRSAESNQRMKASRTRLSVIAKIGEDEMFEVMGIGRQATMRKIAQLKDAKMVRTFIMPQTGAIIESQPYDDNTTQMTATKLMAGIHKMVDDGKGGAGAVTVNIVNYAPPGSPGWPGGGRG